VNQHVNVDITKVKSLPSLMGPQSGADVALSQTPVEAVTPQIYGYGVRVYVTCCEFAHQNDSHFTFFAQYYICSD